MRLTACSTPLQRDKLMLTMCRRHHSYTAIGQSDRRRTLMRTSRQRPQHTYTISHCYFVLLLTEAPQRPPPLGCAHHRGGELLVHVRDEAHPAVLLCPPGGFNA